MSLRDIIFRRKVRVFLLQIISGQFISTLSKERTVNTYVEVELYGELVGDAWA